MLPFSGQRNASEGNGLCRTHAASYFLVITCLGEGFYTMSPGHLLPVLGLLGLEVGDSDDKIHVALHMVLILMTSWYICTFFTFFTSKCFLHPSGVDLYTSINSRPRGPSLILHSSSFIIFRNSSYMLPGSDHSVWKPPVCTWSLAVSTLDLSDDFLSAKCDDTSL